MKLAIISDTHDHMKLMAKVTDYLNQEHIDLLVHCGDWDMPFTMRAFAHAAFPIKSVLGNGDPDIQKFQYQLQNLPILKNTQINIQPEMQDFVVDGKRFAVFHGDDKSVSKLIIESQLYDVYCTGHNHTYNIEKKGKTLVINPGSFIGYKVEIGEEPVYMVVYNTQTDTAQTIDLKTIL